MLLIILLILGTVRAEQMYKLVRHPSDRGAACLDGTQAGTYIHEGDPNKFMIYFNSGGFCGAESLSATLESCYQRSFTSLGSTQNSPDLKSFSNQGLLSPYKDRNPTFYNWTKVYVIYCDGSEHQGSRIAPIAYRDRNLYFRGINNSLEQFYYLNKTYDFYNKEAIVITGVSAGGIATYFYSNYLYDNTVTSKIYSIPDSGLFLTDYQSPILKRKILRERAANILTIVNVEGSFIFPQCLKKFDGDVVQCFNVANLSPYLKAPMLIIESAYDQYSIENIVVARCLTNNDCPYALDHCNSTERDAIEDYRRQVLAAIYELKGNRSNVGLWSPSCVQHGFTDTYSFNDPDFKVPSGRGKTVSDAIQQFLDDPENPAWRLDELGWPFNEGCNGLHNSKRSIRRRGAVLK